MKQLGLLLIFLPLFSFSQNVGIGTGTPSGKLQINHRSSLVSGIKLVDSTTNISGVIEFQNIDFIRGMKIAGFSSTNFNNGQYLDIRSDSIVAMTVKGNGFIGVRDLEPSYPLDINGDINTTGAIRLNGSAGASGQVLVSGGNAADPGWADAALTNNTRFAISFTNVTGSMIADAAISGTKYNLNPADVVIGSNSITINRAGLYHFDINVSSFISFSVVPVPFAAMSITFHTGTPNYPLLNNKLMTPNSTANTAFRIGETYSLDCYIEAASTIRLAYSFGFSTPITYFMSGYLTGHLIAE